MTKRIFLSPPHVSGRELDYLGEALRSNWIAPLGPMVDAFEKEVCGYVGVEHGVALSSGTAALHLAILIAGVQREDDVLCATLTFSATANAIAYAGAHPVFIDCDRTSWNIDPGLLRRASPALPQAGKLRPWSPSISMANVLIMTGSRRPAGIIAYRSSRMRQRRLGRPIKAAEPVRSGKWRFFLLMGTKSLRQLEEGCSYRMKRP